MKMHIVTSRLAWVLLSFTAGPLASSQADTIKLQDGTSIRGEIKATTPNDIEIAVQGESRKVSLAQVQQVVFDEEPSSMKLIREFVADRQWEQALQSLNRVEGDELQDPFVQQEVAFYRAYCQAQLAMQTGSGINEAAKEMFTFAAQHRDSLHWYLATESLGDLAMRLGRPDKAADFYEAIRAATWPAMSLRGTLLKADSLALQGGEQTSQAMTLYGTIIDSKAEGPEVDRLQQLALIGKARCQSDSGAFQEAIDTLHRVIADNEAQDGALFARAYNALGTSFRAAGKPEDALLAFLHVDLLFHDNSEDHAQALHHLSQLWDELGKADRAQDARNRLRNRYAGSNWAKKP